MNDEAEANGTAKSTSNRKDTKTRSPEEQAQLNVLNFLFVDHQIVVFPLYFVFYF